MIIVGGNAGHVDRTVAVVGGLRECGCGYVLSAEGGGHHGRVDGFQREWSGGWDEFLRGDGGRGRFVRTMYQYSRVERRISACLAVRGSSSHSPLAKHPVRHLELGNGRCPDCHQEQREQMEKCPNLKQKRFFFNGAVSSAIIRQ